MTLETGGCESNNHWIGSAVDVYCLSLSVLPVWVTSYLSLCHSLEPTTQSAVSWDIKCKKDPKFPYRGWMVWAMPNWGTWLGLRAGALRWSCRPYHRRSYRTNRSTASDFEESHSSDESSDADVSIAQYEVDRQLAEFHTQVVLGARMFLFSSFFMMCYHCAFSISFRPWVALWVSLWSSDAHTRRRIVIVFVWLRRVSPETPQTAALWRVYWSKFCTASIGAVLNLQLISFSWLIVLCTDLWTVSSFEICWFSVGCMPQSFLRSDDVETSYKCRLTAFEWGFTAASSAIRSHSCFSFQLRTHWFSSGCRSVMIAYAPLFDECIDPSVALRLSVLLWIFN